MVHRHHGKSSANFLDSGEILNELNFKGDETFMDAGCGDGHIALKAVNEFLPNGRVYAVDNHAESINDLEEYKKENHIENLITVEADLTKEIPGVDDDSVDVVLMVNVFHGFGDNGDDVISELKRIIKNDGKVAIVDFKPIEMQKGPPLNIRLSHCQLEELFNNHNFRKVHLNVDIGDDIGETKSHYLIIFQKE